MFRTANFQCVGGLGLTHGAHANDAQCQARQLGSQGVPHPPLPEDLLLLHHLCQQRAAVETSLLRQGTICPIPFRVWVLIT